MTRKDYILLAQVLADVRAMLVRDAVKGYARDCADIGCSVHAKLLAQALARDNPNFDRARFLKAAGCEVTS